MVVSNREPYIHDFAGNEIRCQVPASGLTVALDPVMRACSGIWLTKKEEEGYYLGFSNEALWPLCHIAYTPPTFDEADWNTYQKVNRLFAEAVVDEVGDSDAVIFI